MEELKTLNDIEQEEERDYKSVGEDYTGWSTCERIKQEAIKWVIHYQNQMNIPDLLGSRPYFMGKRDALIDFNNITEEDLK